MKPIKIHADNACAIESALHEANGRAEAHAYTYFAEVSAVAEGAEKALARLDLPKTARVGATWAETSGGAVNNTYARRGFSRRATTIKLERRATGWFLVNVSGVDVGQSGGGPGRLTLTPTQDAEAIRRMRATYTIAE